MSVQTLSVQDVYSRGGRTPTTSARATPGATVPQAAGQNAGASPELDRALAVTYASRPLYGVGMFVAMLIGLQLLAQRVGTQDDFRELRLSVYNVIVIGLAAMIGIVFWKVLFTRFPVPHLTPFVLAV